MSNLVKTIFLLGVLSAILIVIGRIIGGQQGMIVALLISLVMNGVSYFFSDKIALKASGAKPLDPLQNQEIFTIVKNLSQKMKIPMPKLYITPASQANAFATGRSPKHASIAVTSGILKALDKKELEGVLAHELGHIKNRDILIASIAAVLASSISFMGNMVMFGGMGRSDDENNNSSGIFAIIAALLIPIAAMLIQFAISRSREYAADEIGANVIGDGKPLASALIAIHETAKQMPMKVNPAYSSLYIGNPLGNIKVGNLFSTHPPVEDRVKKLRGITNNT